MSDYIKREDAEKILAEVIKQAEENTGCVIVDTFTGWSSIESYAQEAMSDATSADVEPVRHGHWIRESVGSDNSSEGYFKISMAECSECGTCVMGKPNYCPNCGARMRMTKDQYESHVGDIYEDGEEE